MQDAWEAIEDAANNAFPTVPSEKVGSGASGGGSGGSKVVEGEGRKLPRPSTGDEAQPLSHEIMRIFHSLLLVCGQQHRAFLSVSLFP